MARSDTLYKGKGPLIKIENERDVEATTYNYRVQVRLRNHDFVWAELDTDSHISLITPDLFNELEKKAKIDFLPLEPICFEGMGSSLVSPHPPFMLDLQMGQCSFRVRFSVCEQLTSSPVLLGSDFTVGNGVSAVKFSNGYFCIIGPADDPIGKVPCSVTHKLCIATLKTEHFDSYEIKKIKVTKKLPNGHLWTGSDNWDTPFYENMIPTAGAKLSPFHIISDAPIEDEVISVQNISWFPSELPEGFEIAETVTSFRTHGLRIPEDIESLENKVQNYEKELVLTEELIEQNLEPGFNSPCKVDKNKELTFIKEHKKIPEKFKNELIEFLSQREKLFSGNEFSEECFPRDRYEHDVELTTPITGLHSKYFPVSGIRLAQLKEDINSLVENGVLTPGDSPFTSPCFYVMKKATDGKTANKGRLCFDYRRLNVHVKMKNFPINNSKNFFDEAAKFQHFCVLDIKNAFLSIPLTERAREYLAIITPFGTYLPNRSPFGLKTSPSAFCFAMSMVLGDLKFCQIYVDDIHVGGKTERELVDNLKVVFDRLNKFNLKIQLSKCKFFCEELKMLGLIFSKTGKKVDPEKITAIEKFGPIDTLKKCQSFLGMLAYLSSFIPHFSSTCAPLYSLLKDQKTKPFTLTEEAMVAYEQIKNYISKATMLFHPNFDEPLYLSTDASNVGAGGFLYQIQIYEKNDAGYEKMMSELGFVIEGNGASPHLLPGVSPGKNTTVVLDFCSDETLLKKHDKLDTLNPSLTMTEKIEKIQNNYVIHVRPVSFYSKSFSSAQTLRYSTMEKEFLSLMVNVVNFRDYMSAAPVTFILTDNQPVVWALKHKDTHLKLARWLCKLFELNVNLIVTHVAGVRNSVADFLSRIYYVPPNSVPKEGDIGPSSAQHIKSPFPYLSVITPEDVIRGFTTNLVAPCKEPELCHLNVNNFLFKNLGPCDITYTCLDKKAKVKTLKSENFSFAPKSLQSHLNLKDIVTAQRQDDSLERIFLAFEKGEGVGRYLMKKDVLFKSCVEKDRPDAIVVPRSLIMYIIGSYHFMTHAGAPKLLGLIRLKYTWKNMESDILEFTKGCCLCAIYKHSTQGQNALGKPRAVLRPNQSLQIDICTMSPVNGYKSFLNVVDMFTGFSVPIPLKNETSKEIAEVIKNQIFKIFGPPQEISSDNASNLQGPELKKLFGFFNVSSRQTVPYSPTSHALVEISNRYIVQLVRILSDQFKTSWVETLTIAALMYNSVPRVALKNHSPYALMYGRELFGDNDNSDNNNNLELSDYLLRSKNDKNFVKLLRERLLKIRELQNQKRSKRILSFPKGTLILVRDNRPRNHRKLKPVYLKLPQIVVSEYHGVVYAQDIFYRVRKHSKNNIKIASERSKQLFGKLPDDIKLALGDEFDTDKWLEIRDQGIVPLYLEDIEINMSPSIITRSNMPEASHLVASNEPAPQNKEDDDSILMNLVSDTTLKQLNELHTLNLLTEVETLAEVPTLYHNRHRLAPDGDVSTAEVGPDQLMEDGENMEEASPPTRTSDVDPANIILGNRLRNRVKFRLPTS